MKSTVMIMILVILCCLAFVVPGSAAKTGNQGMLVQAHQSTGTTAFLSSYASQKPVVAVWQPAIISTSPARQKFVPENQLVSSYAALISSGSSFAYPGGMAATMGGGGCGGS